MRAKVAVASLLLVAGGSLFGVLGLAPGVTTVAAADYYGYQFGPCGNDVWPCSPDDGNQLWCLAGNIETTAENGALRESILWALNNMVAQTVMVHSRMVDCASYTDVQFMNSSLIGGGAFGTYECVTPQSNGYECASADVTFNRQAISEAATSAGDHQHESGEIDYNRDKTACHELGHSLGFDHHFDDATFWDDHENDCQVSGWRDFPTSGWRKYNGHHINHINNYAAANNW